MKKRKTEPLQLLDVLPVVEDEDTLLDELPVLEDIDTLLDELLVVEDEDTVMGKSVSPSTLLSPLVAGHTIATNKSSLLQFCLPNVVYTCTQAYTVPPSSDLFDNEGPLSSDEHCLVKSQLGAKNLKQIRDGINIKSDFGMVAPRLNRKTRSKSIADGYRYNF